MKPIFCTIALVFLAGCAGTYDLDYEKRLVSITSQPAGAEVFQTDPFTGKRIFLGRTPIRGKRVEVVADASYTRLTPEQSTEVLRRIGVVEIVVQKPGYEKYRGQVKTRRNETVNYHVTLKSR